MSTDASNALQAAVFSALSSDPILTALIGADRVRDYNGPISVFPMVTIGGDTVKDWSGCTFDGQETTIMIHSWAQGQGRRDVKAIMARIYQILHRASLNLAGQSLVFILFEFASTDLDPDGVTYHGVQRFRAITQGD